ncbi:MAG: oligosaccharide flippase family protein, partial [Sinorhizobium meliloti]|nr:oligosaccharide flippase family protein [Sinorhizobium meliloti]
MALRKKLLKKIGSLRQILSREKTMLERLQSIAHLLTGNILSSVIGLIGFALTARALGPAGYGILALCFSYTRAVERIVSFQSWQPLIKYGAHSLAENADDATELRALLKFGLLL